MQLKLPAKLQNSCDKRTIKKTQQFEFVTIKNYPFPEPFHHSRFAVQLSVTPWFSHTTAYLFIKHIHLFISARAKCANSRYPFHSFINSHKSQF